MPDLACLPWLVRRWFYRRHPMVPFAVYTPSVVPAPLRLLPAVVITQHAAPDSPTTGLVAVAPCRAAVCRFGLLIIYQRYLPHALRAWTVCCCARLLTLLRYRSTIPNYLTTLRCCLDVCAACYVGLDLNLDSAGWFGLTCTLRLPSFMLFLTADYS